MAEIAPTLKDNRDDFQSWDVGLTGTGDYIILNFFAHRNASILVNGLSADEIKVYGAVNNDSTTYTQILDTDDINPFTADGLQEIEVVGLSKLKIEKVGAGDALVTIEVGLSK